MSEVAVIEPCYRGVIKDDMSRRPTQCDPMEEPSIDPENMPEPLGGASLAAQKRTRERFHQGMPVTPAKELTPSR
jgi:hypothetical protein